MITKLAHLGALLLGALLLVSPGQAENWPQFRGPRGDGTSLEKNLPLRWSPTENVLWKTPLPGEGHSSPIVWGESVFLTTALANGQRVLLRLEAASGKVLWQQVVIEAGSDAMHRENNSASSTPLTDGTYVFTSFQAGDRVDIRAFDFAGKTVWTAQPLRFEGEHGYSYSPILHGNLLIFDCRQEGEAALLALDKRTGNIQWRATPGRQRISHVPPLLIPDPANPQVIVCGSDEIRSYHPDTGEALWFSRGPSDVAVAGLAYGQGMVFATAGYPNPTRLAVRVNGRGDVTESHVAWSLRRQVSYVPSPVYHEGHLYTVVDGGLLYCFAAASGEPVWDQRLDGRFRASLVLAEGRIYATNEKGRTTVFEATPQAFRLLATNDLAEQTYATPALAAGRLFVRTGEHLYCLGYPRAD